MAVLLLGCVGYSLLELAKEHLGDSPIAGHKSLWPVAAVGVVAYVMHLFTEFCHKWVHHLYSERIKTVGEFFHNQDLTHLVGEALRYSMLAAAEGTAEHPGVAPAGTEVGDWVLRSSQGIPRVWQKLSNDAGSSSSPLHFLSEGSLWRVVQDPHHFSVDPAGWDLFLNELDEAGVSVLRNKPETAETLRNLVSEVNRRIGKAVWEAVKFDVAKSGRAAKALEMVCFEKLLTSLPEAKTPAMIAASADVGIAVREAAPALAARLGRTGSQEAGQALVQLTELASKFDAGERRSAERHVEVMGELRGSSLPDRIAARAAERLGDAGLGGSRGYRWALLGLAAINLAVVGVVAARRAGAPGLLPEAPIRVYSIDNESLGPVTEDWEPPGPGRFKVMQPQPAEGSAYLVVMGADAQVQVEKFVPPWDYVFEFEFATPGAYAVASVTVPRDLGPEQIDSLRRLVGGLGAPPRPPEFHQVVFKGRGFEMVRSKVRGRGAAVHRPDPKGVEQWPSRFAEILTALDPRASLGGRILEVAAPAAGKAGTP